MLEIDVAIYNKWTGDNGAGGVATLATGGIFFAEGVSQQAATPRATYRQVSNIPVYTLPELNHRRVVYQLEGVVEGLNNAAAEAIKNRAQLLHSDVVGNALYSALSVSGWIVVRSRPMGELPPYSEVDGGLRYQHVGFEVELIIAPS